MPYRGMGYGSAIAKYIKEESKKESDEFLIISTDQSEGFWSKVGLDHKGIKG